MPERTRMATTLRRFQILTAMVVGALCAGLLLMGSGGDLPALRGSGHGSTHFLHALPVAATVAESVALDRTGWTATATTAETGQEDTPASNVLDGSTATLWHSTWSTGTVALPQSITVDTKAAQAVSGLTYTPRTDSPNGRIGQYQVALSTDGTTWATSATGTWADDATVKTIAFTQTSARYVRLTAVTEAGGRGKWASAAEIGLTGPPSTTPPTSTPTTAPTTAPTTPAASQLLDRTTWTASATSAETAGEDAPASNVLDGSTATIWHSNWATGTPALPQAITLDLKAERAVDSLRYTPRADSPNGRIGTYVVSTSLDGSSWTNAVGGTWADSAAVKTAAFTAVTARYVRLTAQTEAGARGPWASAAELNLTGTPAATTPTTPPTTTPPTTAPTTTPAQAVTLPRADWTAIASDYEGTGENAEPGNVLDGSTDTIWHSAYSTSSGLAFPHGLTIDMHARASLASLVYTPRTDGSNGRIGRYEIYTSLDGSTWGSAVATGTWADTATDKTVGFTAVTARYVKLQALSEAGNRGNWSSAAEINLTGTALDAATTPNPAVIGSWGPAIGFPLVPAAAALLPDNKVLLWSAFATDGFAGGTGKTQTAILDLTTGTVSQRLIVNTEHDMFCPGVAILADGRIMVTGGNDATRTSIYNPATDTWAAGPDMKIGRGYQGQTLLPNGGVLTLGGSWNGGQGGKYGEVWTAAGGWKKLTGVSADAILTGDAAGIYRSDNHAWLFPVSGGRLLHAGPSKQMNWITTTGNGTITGAGTRADSPDMMNGNAVMYDKDKILTLGGSPSYENSTATHRAYVVDVSGSTPKVTRTGDLARARAFSNSVVLPDGTVLALGGQPRPVTFSDAAAVQEPELWNPAGGTFTTMAAETTPRTYHSVSLLLPDGRVFLGGGGLCGTGCATNHPDGQIFTPPYLLNADGTLKNRPVLSTVPATASAGSTLSVTTTGTVQKFALVRYGEATHSVDNDQRRIPLTVSGSTGTSGTGGSTYKLAIPSDKGVVLPGPYLLFALDADGVPSVAKTVTIS